MHLQFWSNENILRERKWKAVFDLTTRRKKHKVSPKVVNKAFQEHVEAAINSRTERFGPSKATWETWKSLWGSEIGAEAVKDKNHAICLLLPKWIQELLRFCSIAWNEDGQKA